MNTSPFFEVALSLIDRIGAVTAKQLISYCGSAEAVFKTAKSKLLRIPQIGMHTAQLIMDHQKEALEEAEKILQKAEKESVQILCFYQKDYPQRLKDIHDSPLILYYQGNTSLNPEKSVAIVGTRDASNYGKNITEELVADLQKHKVLIVSGLAYGIDIAAHRASLKNELPTVGVMASGIDIIYPSVHKNTAQQMLHAGGLLTESCFGTKPDAVRFPARNRIIAGLADAVVVVEAKEKGGALITAEIANGYHKDVFAIPGNINSKTSQGCNWLIKNHKANLISSVEDLIYMMNWDVQNDKPGRQQTLNFEKIDLDEPDRQIILCLQEKQNEGMRIDELSYKLQTPIAQIQARLMNLELLGLIQALPGKKFVLN
ncbi:MAG: DNA-processing protein DprA [Microscillaceae bacterium]|nr:DNA-processing protein DprA [Microscillaceae bacterium]